MKLFVNLLVLMAVSIPSVYAEEKNAYLSSADALGLTQIPVSLKLDKSTSGETKISESKVTGCNQDLNSFKNDKLIGWAEKNQDISKFYTCSDSRNVSLLRFSSTSCSEAVSCRKNVAQMQVSTANADKLMNEIVAKDYAKNLLDQNAESMNRLELLKQFAKKKYDDQLGANCSGRFQPSKKAGTCNLSLLEEVFLDQQAKCSFGNGCYNKSEPKVLNFKNYKDQEKVAKTAFIVDYNDYRINEVAKKSIDEDSGFVAELADLVTSDDFKKATSDQKGDMFLKKMEASSGDRYRDPILAFDFDSVSEKAKLKKMLKFKQLASVYEDKDLTKESFAANFNSFRKKRAEAVLGDAGACKETADIKKICEDMTSLALGKTLPKDSLSVEHLSSRDLKSEKDFDKFKSLMGANFNEKDFDTLVNAKRCLSFGLASEDYSQGNSDERGLSNRSIGSLVGSMIAPNEAAVDSSKDKISNYIGDTGVAKSDTVSASALDPKLGTSESQSSTGLESALANSQATAPNFGNSFNQAFTPGSYGLDDDKKEEHAEKKDEAASATPASDNSSANNEKLNDLTRRLASAEDEVDKMKAANDKADADREKQKKVDEENALIKDLKGQISDLKAAKDKKEEKAVAIASPVIEQAKAQSGNNFNSSFNSGLSNSSSRQDNTPKAVSDNYDPGRNEGAGSNSYSNASRTSGSNAILSAGNNAENNKASASGAVITTVDGMTAEKATQTISTRILELNGAPFYIEEGGMVKEIIAVVKDGKVLLDEKGNPIYEKIVKGKVGDKKFAKLKDKSNRTPAAITNVGDLKRDQEEKLKRERAEYMKLKSLTNGIIEGN